MVIDAIGGALQIETRKEGNKHEVKFIKFMLRAIPENHRLN